MKRKRQYELDKDSHLEQTFNPEPESELWIEAHLAPGWWKHPVFDFGIHYPCPYIWFGYWLITWEEEEEEVFPAFRFRLFYWRHPFLNVLAGGFRFVRISISFMPD